MSKQRPDFPQPPGERKPAPIPEAKPKAKAKPKAPSLWPWGRFRRMLTSLLIVFHLAAVFAAPWYIQLRDVRRPALAPGTVARDAQGREIPLEELDINEYPPQRPHLPLALYELFFHYANLLYINNGYDFFSPDPGPSQLVRYWVYDANDEEIETDMFPDRQRQWPRLFYHRHMMLAAQVSEFGEEGLRIYARHLLRKHGGARIHLELGVHHLLTPDQVMSGKVLDASDTYEVIDEVDEYAAPSAAPAATGGEIRIPGAAR